MNQQDTITPPSFVRALVLDEISKTPLRSFRHQWAGAVLGLIILAILWGIVQPGIVLQWTWENGDLQTFQVYRASEGSQDFSLIREIPTQETSSNYTYVDPLLVPGLNYSYQIIGIDSQGDSIFSQIVTDSSIGAMPGQIAIIVTSLVITFGLVQALEQINIGNLKKHKTAVN